LFMLSAGDLALGLLSLSPNLHRNSVLTCPLPEKISLGTDPN